uniref:Fatty acid-binding protein 3 n=3 Tax=Ascaris suum TaxID=6253 RepID=F1LFL1_ASCSU
MLLVSNKFSMLMISFSLILSSTMASTNVRIPEKFLGTFKLDRSENFDEFLASKGVNWFVRKMIGFASVTKIFAVSKSDPDSYDMSNLTSKKNTHFNNWKLNQTFEAEGLDGKMHKITFNFDDATDTLKETHVRMDDPNDKGETYYYTIEGDELLLKMANDKVTCRRFFKREQTSS